MLDETEVSQLKVTLLLMNTWALTLNLWVINRAPSTTGIPPLESDSTWREWEWHYHWQMQCFYPRPPSPWGPVHTRANTCPVDDCSSLLPARLQTWEKKRRVNWIVVTLLYVQGFAIMWGESSTGALFFFLFPFSPVFRHYVATAVAIHRAKCTSLPFPDGLQVFLVSTPFSNAILCETSVYKADRGTFC